HGAARCVVDRARADVHGARELRRLRDLGRLPERALPLRGLPLAVLLPRDLRRLAARVARPEARAVAGVASVLAGPDHPSVPGSLPADLLLLPGHLLQVVLGRPAVVRGWRAAIVVSG